MKLNKIDEIIAVSVYSKQEAWELVSILCENGYNYLFSDSLPEYNNWNNHCIYFIINPDYNYVYWQHSMPNCLRYNLKDFKHKMEKKEITEVKINVPEGYEIDKENSTFECIKFKPKKLTYEDIAKKLFDNAVFYYSGDWGKISVGHSPQRNNPYSNGNHATTEKQLKKLRAINKLMNVAKYLNDGWKPDWNNTHTQKWLIAINSYNNKLDIVSTYAAHYIDAYFKTKELAKQAIDILGEDTIRLALLTDW